MKKIILLFLFVYSFAINDFLVKPKLSDYSFTPLLPKVLYSYSDEDNYNVSLGANKVIPYNELNLSKGWNLVFYSSNLIDLNNTSENRLIWTYGNNWKYYSNSITLNGVDKFQYIIPGKGYFVYNP